MSTQTFKTYCLECGKEVDLKVLYLTEENEIIVNFMQDIELKCNCGTATCISMDFLQKTIDLEEK